MCLILIFSLFIILLGAQISLENLSCLCGLKDGTKTIRNIPVGCKTVVVPTKQPGEV